MDSAVLLEVLADLREPQAWNDGYAEADLVARHARQYDLDVTAAAVGRRLSQLAAEGVCRRRGGRYGSWEYRAADKSVIVPDTRAEEDADA